MKKEAAAVYFGALSNYFHGGTEGSLRPRRDSKRTPPECQALPLDTSCQVEFHTREGNYIKKSCGVGREFITAVTVKSAIGWDTRTTPSSPVELRRCFGGGTYFVPR